MGRPNKDRDRIKIALIATVPWWGWILLGGVAWLAARGLTNVELPSKGAHVQVINATLTRVVGAYLSLLAPLIGVLLAIISARGRRQKAPSDPHTPRMEPSLGVPKWGRSHHEDAHAIDTTSWNLALITTLEWKRLEQLSALYFRALEFRVEEADCGPDGGVDLRLFAGGASTPSILVQCKAWNSWKIGVKEVRALLGVMSKERVSEGIFVTTSTFTDEAVRFARGTNIALIDGNDLLCKLRDLPAEDQSRILEVVTSGDFTTPTCPSCGVKMVMRVAKRGGDSFWGCSRYPACRGSISIGRRAHRSGMPG